MAKCSIQNAIANAMVALAKKYPKYERLSAEFNASLNNSVEYYITRLFNFVDETIWSSRGVRGFTQQNIQLKSVTEQER